MKLTQLSWSITRMESGKTGAWYMEEQEFGKSHIAGTDQTTTLGYPMMEGPEEQGSFGESEGWQ